VEGRVTESELFVFCALGPLAGLDRNIDEELELRLEFVRQNLYLIFPAVASGLALIYFTFFAPEKKLALTTTQATLLINRESAQVIDLRSPGEYAEGHVPDSRNIPLDQFDARIDDFEKYRDSPLIFVCKRGSEASRVSIRLAKKGFAKSRYIEGGIEAWRDDGLLLKKGTKR
jgi:rhodanese-related sulfurtransferase